MALSAFAGTWQMESHDNFEAFLDAMEVPAPVKAKALSVKPTAEVAVDGNNVSIKLIGPERTIEQKLTLGEVFDLVNPVTGQTRKGIASMEGSTLVVKPGEQYPKEPKSCYDIVGDKMVCTMSVGDVSCKRTFAKA
ncbi:fatty acid-binding protein-like [Ptychodera flava]|uniref:fatty acid-binding protein-like n=1 Tax=Ptychodera flava TaxID=63121 RepID=UPI00396A7A3D